MTLTEYQKELQHIRNDSFTNFERQLINNEITCIEPYFEDHFPMQKIHRKIMALHGLYIDKLIEINDKHVNAELVRRGHAKEYYEEWAENGEHVVQEALLEKGLHIDILSQSKDENIQFEVAKQYPELTLEYLKSLDTTKQRWLGFQLLMSQSQPNIKALKFLLTRKWHITGYNLQILKNKYKLMHKPITIIERTMSPFQLYQARNPLWKLNLSGYNIASVKYGQKKFDSKNLILTKNDSKAISHCTDTNTVDQYIYWNIINRKD